MVPRKVRFCCILTFFELHKCNIFNVHVHVHVHSKKKICSFDLKCFRVWQSMFVWSFSKDSISYHLLLHLLACFSLIWDEVIFWWAGWLRVCQKRARHSNGHISTFINLASGPISFTKMTTSRMNKFRLTLKKIWDLGPEKGI